MSLHIVPLGLATANAAVRHWHRHHQPAWGYKWALGAEDGAGILHGVAIAARPVARMLDNGRTLEVTRLASDGTPNVCSFLYAAARRVAREMGYELIITYTLVTEPGTSLRAAGWELASTARSGRTWDMPSRPRAASEHMNIAKHRWESWLRPEKDRRVLQGRPQFGHAGDTGTLFENIG